MAMFRPKPKLQHLVQLVEISLVIMEKRKAIFFDRDGVVNFRIVGEYINREENFVFTPDFLEILPILKSKGYLVILISNQKGVGKGIMTKGELERVTNFMNNYLLQTVGYEFDDMLFCTDVDEVASWRLKPNPGMIFEAIEKWDVDTSNSWIIGDSMKDVIAGKRASIKSVLVGINSEKVEVEPDYRIRNLIDFLKLIK